MFESGQFVTLARIIVAGLCLIAAAGITEFMLDDFGFVPALVAIATIGVGLYASPIVLAAWTQTTGDDGSSSELVDYLQSELAGHQTLRGPDDGRIQ